MTWRTERAGYIYIIKCGSIYKVGATANVASRFRAIELGSCCNYPFVKDELAKGSKLQLLHSFPTERPHYLEHLLHSRFHRVKCRDPKRQYGYHTEWFRFPKDVVDWLCSIEHGDETLCPEFNAS